MHLVIFNLGLAGYDVLICGIGVREEQLEAVIFPSINARHGCFIIAISNPEQYRAINK